MISAGISQSPLSYIFFYIVTISLLYAHIFPFILAMLLISLSLLAVYTVCIACSSRIVSVLCHVQEAGLLGLVLDSVRDRPELQYPDIAKQYQCPRRQGVHT